MAIVSDLPFSLKLVRRFPRFSSQEAVHFADDEREIWGDGFVTLSVEENDEIELYFNSPDRKARLYLEALDIVSVYDRNIREDEEGRLYRAVSDSRFVLYANDGGYDALRVDNFQISVFCSGKWYYGVFQVLPKPMSMSEWQMMRDDLEREVRGLAQEMAKHSAGLGKGTNEIISPKLVYDFLVIKKYADQAMMAMMDISENPRNEIVTRYRNVDVDKGAGYRFDGETVKRFLMKSGAEMVFKVPVKAVSYDIQDNRLLKMILESYEKKLQQFIEMVNDAEQSLASAGAGDSLGRRVSWEKSLSDFKASAQKLKKMTSIIKVQEWYSEVGDYGEPDIPHSFILDSRYNLLYQMYLDLKKEGISVELNPNFSYTWKRSSYMYEMWCYLKVCRLLMEEYDAVPAEGDRFFSDRVIFPLLEAGTKLQFEKDRIRLEVVYDQRLPLCAEDTSMENPLYMAKRLSDGRMNNRPDIVINVFEQGRGLYLGSIILECKYRKLRSFLRENSEMASFAQLESYYNYARSKVLLGKWGGMLGMRPVAKVIVLTPDDEGEGVTLPDYGILVKGFKASDDNDRLESVKKVIFEEISFLERRLAVIAEPSSPFKG